MVICGVVRAVGAVVLGAFYWAVFCIVSLLHIIFFGWLVWVPVCVSLLALMYVGGCMCSVGGLLCVGAVVEWGL